MFKNIKTAADLASEAFSKAVEAKKTEIRAAYNEAASAPVMHNNISWHGGYDSGQKLNSARELALKKGQATVFVSDTDNVLHELTLDELDAVVIEVSDAFQAVFVKKQQLFTQIADATEIQQLDAIVW